MTERDLIVSALRASARQLRQIQHLELSCASEAAECDAIADRIEAGTLAVVPVPNPEELRPMAHLNGGSEPRHSKERRQAADPDHGDPQ